MYEPRMRRGRPAKSVRQKIDYFKEQCFPGKPTNGKEDIGPCLCHRDWNKQINVPGHGRVRLGRLLLFLAGRITEWQLWHSPKNVLHDCRNEFCFNVDHLRLGTTAENSKDSVRDLSQPMVLDRTQIYLLLTEWFIKGNHDFYKLLTDRRFYYRPRGANHPLK